MVANGGDPQGLFSAIIIESGGPMGGVYLDAGADRNTETFRNVSRFAGCGNATDQVDCLRNLPWSTLNTAITASRNVSSVLGNNVYQPVIHPDDFFYPERPRALIAAGKVCDVPILAGSNHDEGGYFGSRFAPYIGTEADFLSWFTTMSLVGVDEDNASDVMDTIYELYPDDPVVGCPYTSNATATSGGFTNDTFRWFSPLETNQYKRATSLWSDWNFVAPRRYLMQKLNSQKQTGSRNSALYGYLFGQIGLTANATEVTARLGAGHTYELPYFFCTLNETCSQTGGSELGNDVVLYDLMQSSWVGFINFRDPNSIQDASWPEYGNEGLLQSLKGSDYNRTLTDDYRSEPIGYLISDEAAPVLGY